LKKPENREAPAARIAPGDAGAIVAGVRTVTETKRLEEIFSQAIQLPGKEERDKFVEKACEGVVELKQQVFALLRAAQEAGSFLESPVRMSDNSGKTEFPFLTPSNTPGELGMLGPYRILNCVGRGGMGIVFRAFDPKLQRVVAVKVLAPEIAINPTARLRFEREARSAAAVSHPHVVVIHAVDETHNPPYLVMEFVQGKTLAEKLAEQGMLSIKETLRIGAQIAEGLAAAHQQGLVHRDVKPANVLLENGVERVKVADFGLAKAVDDVGMTRTGDRSGTPQYMSPEQASGALVDHRTDLFSLGAVLYTMCTGIPPFRADNPLATLKRICEEIPRPIQRGNPDVPDWLCAIVGRLLAKSPGDRFQTAAEVAALLQKHLATVQAGSSIALPALETERRSAWNWRRLWPWPTLVFGLLTGISVLVWFAGERTHRNSSPSEDRKSDSEQARLGDRLAGAGKRERDGLPSRGASKKANAELSSAEGNQPREPVEGPSDGPLNGKEAGDRLELTELNIALRWCPPGRFTMAGPKSERKGDENQDEVLVPRGFWMQETEVTQSQWAKVMGSMPSHKMDKGQGDQHPIYFVSLDEATTFCRKLTELERYAGRLPSGWVYRLPTEAQWEYACRAGTTTDTAFGDQLDSTQANFGGEWPHNGAPKGPSLSEAVKVASYRPNAWGIYDMHGNVKEFTTTPGRVRGGSWCDSGRNCCSGIFIPDPPNASESIGFRVALVPMP
jgi:serine/threonine protein kinase